MSLAQVAPSPSEVKIYTGLLAAAARGDAVAIDRLLKKGSDPNTRDAYGRNAAHVATHFGRHGALRLLLRRGTNPNTLERDRYDVITIAAVRNDPRAIRIAVDAGGKATNITSRYDGTALIAASHLGNIESVRVLIEAKAPLNHVNNLGWTALLEAVILGDGGPRHTAVVKALVDAGANVNIADRGGVTPLQHAQDRGYREIEAILGAVVVVPRPG